jgi:hypothetical protein
MSSAVRQIMIGAVPIRLGDDRSEFTMQLNDPGIVHSVAWTLEKRLVMARGEAQFDEVLTMFVEVSPNGTKRNRRFVVLATGQQVAVPDGAALRFAGSAVSGNTGQVAHLFEIEAS